MYSSNNYMLEFNNGLIFYSIYLKNMALNMDTDIPIIELADNTPSWDIQWNENTIHIVPGKQDISYSVERNKIAQILYQKYIQSLKKY